MAPFPVVAIDTANQRVDLERLIEIGITIVISLCGLGCTLPACRHPTYT